MKVNFLLPGLGLSGGNRIVFEYANRLSDRGHNVTIIFPLVPTRMAEPLSAYRPRVTQVFGTVSRLLTRGVVDWFDLDVSVRCIPTLGPAIIGLFQSRIPDADVTVATAWQSAYAVAALDESKGLKAYLVQHYEIWKTWNSEQAWRMVRSVTDDPASYPTAMYEVTPPEKRARREKELVDRSYKLPLSKVAVSPWLSDFLETKFDQPNVDVIPNSVSHSSFYPDPTGYESNSLLLPFRTDRWKGRREVINVVEACAGDVNIHTYGSGEEGDLPDCVTHHSDVSDEELRRLYSDADIFVFPSWVEGYGLPPFEAMACRTAVVATSVGVVPEYANDGMTASIVPPRDSSALVEATQELLARPKKRKLLGEKGRELVTGFSWDRNVTRFEQALREM